MLRPIDSDPWSEHGAGWGPCRLRQLRRRRGVQPLGIVRLAVLVVAVAACGKVSPSAPPDAHVDAHFQIPDGASPKDRCADSIALDDLGACLDQAYCDALSACGLGSVGDTDCRDLSLAVGAGLGTRVLAATAETELGEGRIDYDPIAAAACVAGLRGRACKGFTGDVSDLLDGCAMFVGHVGQFGGCGYPYECASGTTCVVGSGGGDAFSPVCGADVCMARVETGALCANASCRVGDHCVSGSCARGDLGAVCVVDADCDDDFYCGADSTCAAALGKDAACTGDRMCAGQRVCVGDQLSPAAGQCEDVSTLGAACDDRCFGPYLCALANAGELGTCVAAPREGDPCVSPGSCGAVMSCDANGTPDPGDDTCHTPGDLGAACMRASNKCNLGLVCTADVTGTAAGVCRLPLPNDTGCSDPDQCESGSCSNDLCGPPLVCQL